LADLFQECLDFTLTQEGGFVDDPYDPGGATNMGITLATYRSWDHDPQLGVANVKAMSRKIAAAIYYSMYWNVLGGHSLPAGIDLSVFDFGVNAGPRCSAELLQSALNFTGDQVDGCIGPETLRAAAAAKATHVIEAMAQLQVDYYRGLAAFDRFGQGWLDRTVRRKHAALALSAETEIT
jgi:lysozyme family protein